MTTTRDSARRPSLGITRRSARLTRHRCGQSGVTSCQFRLCPVGVGFTKVLRMEFGNSVATGFAGSRHPDEF